MVLGVALIIMVDASLILSKCMKITKKNIY